MIFQRKMLLAAAGIVAIPSSLSAQDTDEPATGDTEAAQKDGDIIVTARRRDERLSDVPTAVSVIDIDSLEERGGAFTTGELLADQPSVRFNNLNSSITSEVSIRASSTARATNGDPSVGLYRNGSYIGGGGFGGRNFSRLDLLDIGRVEVLRGTQGALYGRNAVGGAINIISARPQFELSGFANVRYGFENNSYQAQGAINLPVADGIAVRVSGDVVDQDSGFFFNPVNDVFFDQQDGYGIRGQIRIDRGPLNLILLAETQDLDTPNIHFQVDIPAGRPGFPGGYTQEQFSYPWSTASRATQDIDSFQAIAELDLGGSVLKATTLYRERDSEYDFDNDGLSAPELARIRDLGLVTAPIDPESGSFIVDETTSFNQDLHLTGTALGDRLTWLVGVDLLIQDSDFSTTRTRTPTFRNPSTGNILPSTLDFESYAAYGSLGYDLTERLNVTGELRFTHDDRSISSRGFDLGTGEPFGGPARIIDASISSDNLSFNATLSYELTPDMLTYGKVGTSYRAGGFNTRLSDERAPMPVEVLFDNETSTSYEAGIKGTPGSGFYFAVAGYYTEQDDLIAQVDDGCFIGSPVCPVNPVSFLTNAGDARSYGLEAELRKNFTIGRGTARLALSGSHQDGEVTSGQFDGLDLAQVPEWLASANLNLRYPVAEDVTLISNILFSGQWGGQQELTATSFDLDDFEQVNVRAGVEFGQVRVVVFANNVFDQVYRVARTATVNRFSQPRLIGVEVMYRW